MVNEHICGDMEFSFYRREARAVFVCGDFNDWQQTALPMTGMPDGWWKCQLRLAPGSYQFKYLADSEWYLDYAAFGLEMCPPGTWNSVVLVREEPDEAEPRLAPLADMAVPTQLSEAIFGQTPGSLPFLRGVRRDSRRHSRSPAEAVMRTRRSG